MTRHILSVQISDSLASRLAEHAKQTLIPTSAFVRFAIESALGHPVVDAEPVVQKTYKPVPLLTAQQPERAEETVEL
jgi:hypothetical protein